MKILVVDTDAQTTDVVRRSVKRESGATIAQVENALDALQSLEKETFGLALFELDLPMMNGLRLLEVVRRSPKTASLPVVMMTTRTDEDTIKQLARLGVTGVLVKPLDRTMLTRRLAQWTATASAKPAPSQPQAGPEPRTSGQKTLLVVDGDSHFRHFAADALQRTYRVVQAPTGATALKLALLHRPRTILVGQGLGLLNAELLVAELRAATGLLGSRIVAVSPKNDDGTFSAAIYDGVVTRTFLPEVFLREFDALCGPIGAMTRLLTAYPMLPSDLSTAVSQVFGMMMELDVALVQEGRPELAAMVRASQTMKAPSHHLTFRIDTAAQLPTAQLMTSRLTGTDAAAVAPDDARSTLGEITQIVTGRLRESMSEADIAVQCELPVTHVSQEPIPLDATEVDRTFHFGSADGSVRLEVRVVASSDVAILPVVA